MKNKVQLKSQKAITVFLMWIMLSCAVFSSAKAGSPEEKLLRDEKENLVEDKSVEESSAEEKSAEGKSVEEKSMEEMSAEGNSLADVCEIVKCDSKKRDNQKASYALGVKFHRTVGSKFDELDYAVFLKGLRDASKEEVTVKDKTLDIDLKNVIISEKHQSVMFLKGFIESTKYDVLEIDGVYVEKQPDLPEAWVDVVACDSKTVTDDKYRVRYARLTLDHSKRSLWSHASNDGDGTQVATSTQHKEADCIDLHEREMIRGWRTVLNEMSPDEVWAVAIPPALAYGNRGIKDFVEPDVALYFILELKNKPQSIFQKMGMR